MHMGAFGRSRIARRPISTILVLRARRPPALAHGPWRRRHPRGWRCAILALGTRTSALPSAVSVDRMGQRARDRPF